MTGFESGFAPLVETSLTIGVAHGSLGSFSPGNTMLALGANAGFGGEARFGEHFAIDARVFVQLGGSRASGSGTAIYSEGFGIGSSAGLTLRF